MTQQTPGGDYRLVHGLPGLDDYRRLRAESGLTPVSAAQGRTRAGQPWR